MSINPVQGIEPAAMPPTDERRGPAPTTPSDLPGQAPGFPDSGVTPKSERQESRNESTSQEMPEDEVQVQRTGEANGQIVIKYLDRRGDVVLQVPSAQVLDLARSIAQDLNTASKDHAPGIAQAPGAQGGKDRAH